MGIFFKLDRIPCKDIKDKLFRVSTEVRSILLPEHDRWSPARAFERVKKDLNVLHVLCKVFLAFFKKESDDEHAVCDGRSVKMFADVIMKSLRDEDFVSGMILKDYFMFFLWFTFFRFSLGLRFYGYILLFVVFVDCPLELGVISTEDLGRLASGEIQKGKDKEFSIKTTLEIVNLLTNMYNVRKDVRESALKYLFTNANDNDFEGVGMLKRKSTFESVNESD